MDNTTWSAKKLKLFYSGLFPGSDNHHIVPRSRNGISSQYNLFPFYQFRHKAYHELFWNMKIDEVWKVVRVVHYMIFNSGRRPIIPDWVNICVLDKGSPRKRKNFRKRLMICLSRPKSLQTLRESWINCFGGSSIIESKCLLKYMMLFMVFGPNAASLEFLSDENRIKKFLEENGSLQGDRLWAFKKCFGRINPTPDVIVFKISRILARISYTSQTL